MKRKQVKDGEFVPLAPIQKWACCDCGLVHVVVLRLSGKRLGLQFWRDQRATDTLRKKRNK